MIVAIDDLEYRRLNFTRLNLNAAQMLNARLRKANALATYVTLRDVIVGPLISQPRIQQQKYQSGTAEALLNGPLSQRSVR